MKPAQWTLALVATVAAFVQPAAAQIAEDAKAVLVKSGEAIKATEGLTFKAKKYGTGMLKDIIDQNGEIAVFRAKGAKFPMIKVTGRIKQPTQADKQMTYIGDGLTARWLDASKNLLMERPMSDPAAKQELGMAQQMLVDPFWDNEPFSKELKADKLTKLPDETVMGTPCLMVQAATSDGTRTTTWAIAKSDNLPRRQEMVAGAQGNSISMILELTDMNPNAKLSAKDFDLPMPTGYTKDTGPEQVMPVGMEPLPANTPPPTLGLAVGDAAPTYSLMDATGKEVSDQKLHGKVVVMEFFGTMFKQATSYSPIVQMIADEYKGKNVEIVGFACREPSDKSAAEYFKTNKLTYTLVPAGDTICEPYKVVGFPSYYVIGANGKVAAFFQGPTEKTKLTAAIDGALNAK